MAIDKMTFFTTGTASDLSIKHTLPMTFAKMSGSVLLQDKDTRQRYKAKTQAKLEVESCYSGNSILFAVTYLQLLLKHYYKLSNVAIKKDLSKVHKSIV